MIDKNFKFLPIILFFYRGRNYTHTHIYIYLYRTTKMRIYENTKSPSGRVMSIRVNVFFGWETV